MSISKQAMLCSPSIRTWRARRYDEKATKTVSDKHGSKIDMGRYNKCLIDVNAETYKRIGQIATEAREWSYAHSLPWAQNGARILPAAMYLEYAATMQKFEKRFNAAVDAFIKDYPRLKEKARRALNGLYKEADYPADSEVPMKYGFSVVFLPVPDANDFRVDIAKADAARIRVQITEQVEAATADAMRDLWVRLYEVTNNMAVALKDPKQRFHDTLVSNVKELVEVLPRLNLTHDKKLAEMSNEVKKLLEHSADELREDMGARKDNAKLAAQLAKKMAAFAQVP